ncbi:MAG: coiled-coil domain-containing protein [Candidatus Thorarchaeota archaeon]
MVTKFDSKEYTRERLLNTCSKYFPKDHLKITSGKKGFRLGESTLALIEKAKEIIFDAYDSNEKIPESTVNVFRYGTVCVEIFENLNQYQIISQLKSRSRRGYRKQLDVIDFDHKRMELEFKKSPKPPVKSQKDIRIMYSARKSYLKPFNENDFKFILEDVKKRQNLFIVEGSDGKEFFDSLFRLLNPLTRKSIKKTSLETQLAKEQKDLERTETILAALTEELPRYKQSIELQRKDSKIHEIINEKEQLFSDPDLSLFLKILTTSLERYIKMIERRENRILEEKEDFLSLVLEPTKYQGFNEELWRKIVFIIETHGTELLSGKSWFKFEDPADLREFVVLKDVLEKFARLRKLEDELIAVEEQLETNPEYAEAQRKIQEYAEQEEKLTLLKQKIPKIQEKIETLTHLIEIDKDKVDAFLF